jgi:hypothetical protein
MNVYPLNTEPTDYKVKSSRLPLSEQEKALCVLQETVNELYDNLRPVLEPEYPSETVGPDTEIAEREGSPLQEQLKANNRGIYSINSRLRLLIDRLEC